MYRLALIAALTGVLFAGQAVAIVPPAGGSAAEPSAAASSAGGPKLSPADQKRITAIQQYQHDLVTVVALRAEPDYLLGAAILAKPFRDPTPGLDFDSLSARAAAAPGAGPAVRWQRLAACKTKADCPNSEAMAWLEKHAADNAAVWIVAMDVGAGNKDAGAERAALQKAAAAQTYDDYYGTTPAGIAKAVAVLPPLADTTKGAHDGQPDNPGGVRVLVSVNAAQALPRPDLDPVVALCDKDAVARHKERREACLKLAHTLQWGSSPIARAAGLHIQGELDPADKAQADQASRNLQWQVQQYSHLLQRSLADATMASRWLDTARNGGTELSLMLATLRANGIPLDAPSGGSAAPGSTDGAVR